MSEGSEVIGNDYAIDDISFNEILEPRFVPVKTVDRQTANVGETVNYTVTFTNTCQSPLTDVYFQDTIPNGLAFVSGSVVVNGTTDPGADPNAGFVLPDVPGGETVTVEFAALVTEIPTPNPALNSANITYSYTPIEGGIPGIFNETSNEVPVEVSTLADIFVVKTAAPSPAIPGNMLTYTVTVANAGPSASENVVLTDDIPSSLSNAEYSTNGGGTFAPWSGSLALGSLAAGENRTILVRGTLSPSASGQIVNTAVVSSSTPDPDPDNNTSTDVTPVEPSADLSVVKTANPSPIFAGEVITYTLEIQNAGPSVAVNTDLADQLAAGLLNAEFSTNGGATWVPFNGTIFLGNLQPGSFQQLLIRATVPAYADESLSNTAVVSSGTPDPNPDNNTSTVVTPVIPAEPSADLSVVKSSDPNPVQPGAMLTYTLTISNAGPDTAQNIVLTDTIPAGLLNAEFSLNSGVTWQPWSGSYVLGTLAAGGSIVVLIRAVICATASVSIVNTAVVSSDTPDPDTTNNTSTNITNISTEADLSVSKTAQPAVAAAGELLTYTVTVTNNGRDDAQNVIVYDEIPPELENVQFSIDGGATWNIWTNPYLLGELAAGQSRTVLIRGTVTRSACGMISNTAVATSTTPDLNPDNNTDTDNTPVQGGERGADLSIQKSAYPNQAIRGQYLTYTLAIANSGPETAEQVEVSDLLPDELCNPIVSVDGGSSWSKWEGSLTIGDLAANSSVSILVAGIVSQCAKGCIYNTGTVCSQTHDPNLSNNTSSATVNVWNCCSCKR